MDRAIIFVIDIVLKAGYGCLRIILTDNGGEVTNKLIKGIHGRENAVGESSGASKEPWTWRVRKRVWPVS